MAKKHPKCKKKGFHIAHSFRDRDGVWYHCELPRPVCKLGYPDSQLEEIFDEAKLKELNHWMRGQTGAICDGRAYNYAEKKYEPTGCGPHGMVVYAWDVDRFVAGLPVID